MRNNTKKNCYSCENCIYIGEGDYVCLECGSKPVSPIIDHTPTDEFFKCGGKEYARE